LETSFAIEDDFQNFDATIWVVTEFKRHKLKRLFKPVTSTANKSYISQFYEHLSYNSTKLGVMSSSIQGTDIEVTSTNIATTLKYTNEHPPEEAQLDEQPPNFYIA
jgi:hypothetical protein